MEDNKPTVYYNNTGEYSVNMEPKNSNKLIHIIWAVLVFSFIIYFGFINDDTPLGKVKCHSDGTQYVYDENGRFIAEITCSNNEASYVVFNEYIDIEINGNDYIEHIMYHSDEDGELIYIPDYNTTGYLMDSTGTFNMRYYYYEPEDDEIYWFYGINELSDVKYRNGNAFYVVTDSEENYFYESVYLNNSDYIIYVTSEYNVDTGEIGKPLFNEVFTYVYENNKVIEEHYYYLEGEDTHNDVEGILNYVKTLTPSYSSYFTYTDESNLPITERIVVGEYSELYNYKIYYKGDYTFVVESQVY